MKKWNIKEQDAAEAEKLARECGINTFAAKLLLNRGITSREAAEDFFGDGEITPPEEMTDMEKAAEVINEAIQRGDKITVYGDYDCDGITATVILYGYLEAIGAEADWYIPSREEGYGLNLAAVDKLAAKGTKLIVTVDNGISAAEEAEYIKSKGMSLVITDHHQVPETLPEAEAIVDPHRKDDRSACKELAGCGVALKLVMALEEDIDSVIEQWGDLLAIGTVGDIVPLVGENRTLVKRGLENLQFTENRGLHALLRKSGIDEDREVSSVDLAFLICPRINAAGRFAHPKEAAELFLCENDTMIPVLADRLSQLNAQRKQAEESILAEISEMVDKDPLLLKKRVFTVCGKGWSHGVIGIVASRLLNRFGKPVVIITDEGDTSRGSARSVEGFSLYRMLTELSDHLIKYGGHTKAAGFSLDSGGTEGFIQAIDAYAASNFPEMPADVCTAEMRLTAADLTHENVESLAYFQPFGEANPPPVFLLENCTIKSAWPLKDGKYVAFYAEFQGTKYKVVNFHSTYNAFGYKAGDRVDLLAAPEIDDYHEDDRKIAFKLTDIRYSGFDQNRRFAAQSTYERLCLGEEIPASLAKRVIPDRQAQKAVYDAVRATSSIAAAADIAYSKGINYCMFRVTLDAFENAGLIKINLFEDSFTLLESGKVDLENCPYMTELRKRLGQ